MPVLSNLILNASLLALLSVTCAMSKRARLTTMASESYVSQSALASLLSVARKEGLPDSFSRATQLRVRNEECWRGAEYGPLVQYMDLPMPDGCEPVSVAVQSPFTLLQMACVRSPTFANYARLGMARHTPATASPS